MIHHTAFSPSEIRTKIRKQEIQLGGHAPSKIYGTLSCASGKRMKIHNRVFFESAEEAEANGFRPCGNCIRIEYTRWKSATNGLSMAYNKHSFASIKRLTLSI